MRSSQDARLLGALVAIPVLFLASTARAQVPCTYFAAPLAEEGGKVPEGEPFAARYNVGTPDQPIIVADFWARKLVKPGTVLCLKDGEYRGAQSMIRPRGGQLAGRAGARVEIRAVNDGHVWIDGEFQHATLRLSGHHYWTIQGLNLFNSRGPVVGISGIKQEGERDQEPTRHVILRRIVAWRDYIPYGTKDDYDAIGGNNVHIYSLTDVSDLLVEDCAGFGWARKIFENYRSNRTVFRRNWARWDGRHPYRRGNKFAFSCAYRAYDAICENLIATVGGSRDRAAQPETYAPAIHLIATDASAGLNARWPEPSDRDVHNIGLRIYGSLAYVPPGGVYSRVTGYHIGGNAYPSQGLKGVLIENSVAHVANSAKFAAGLTNCDDDPQKHPDGCSWELKDDRGQAPLLLRRLTLAGRNSARISKDWRQENVGIFSPGRDVDIYKGTVGPAALCKRYVDGRETPLPLWPWPMNDRILTATERSSWPTAHVMSEIAANFGPPPPECTAPIPVSAPPTPAPTR
jgi:hypothetical protein